MKDDNNLIETIRKNIIGTLELLSSHEKQSEYPVPVEWFCFWFDDYYHPKDNFCQQAFTSSELVTLSIFNQYFQSIANKIGNPPSSPNELWVVPAWQDIMNKASETLNQLRDA